MGSANQSSSLITTLPSNTLTRKFIILSRIDLTGAIIFSAIFFSPSNLFSNLFSAASPFSFSLRLLSFSFAESDTFFCAFKVSAIEDIVSAIVDIVLSKLSVDPPGNFAPIFVPLI